MPSIRAVYFMKKLTVKDALAQGYTSYVYNSDGYQSLNDISDVESIDFGRDDIRIVGKEPSHPSTPVAEDIADLLAEQINHDWHEETGCDTDSVYYAIKAIDFTDVHERIKKALSEIDYYVATDIKLIP